MKALRILILALATMIASAASAQAVYNSSGSRCGTIESNGTVRNSSGSSIGRAQGIPREWVAAYFFFFPFY